MSVGGKTGDAITRAINKRLKDEEDARNGKKPPPPDPIEEEKALELQAENEGKSKFRKILGLFGR